MSLQGPGIDASVEVALAQQQQARPLPPLPVPPSLPPSTDAEAEALLELDAASQSAKQMAIIVGRHLGLDGAALAPVEVAVHAKQILAEEGPNAGMGDFSSPVAKKGGGAVKKQLQEIATQLHVLHQLRAAATAATTVVAASTSPTSATSSPLGHPVEQPGPGVSRVDLGHVATLRKEGAEEERQLGGESNSPLPLLPTDLSVVLNGQSIDSSQTLAGVQVAAVTASDESVGGGGGLSELSMLEAEVMGGDGGIGWTPPRPPPPSIATLHVADNFASAASGGSGSMQLPSPVLPECAYQEEASAAVSDTLSADGSQMLLAEPPPPPATPPRAFRSQLQLMLAQIEAVRATEPSAQAQMLDALQPPALGAAARVALTLEPASIAELAQAADAINRGEQPQPEAIGRAYTLFTKLPAESQELVTSHLPPQASAVAQVVCTARIPQASVVRMATAIFALTNPAPPPPSTVRDSVGGETETVAPPPPLSAASLESCDPRLLAALHTEMKQLPPAVTQALLEKCLPKGQTRDLAAAAVEMGAAMEEEDVVELIKGFQSSNAPIPGATTNAPSAPPVTTAESAVANKQQQQQQQQYWRVAKTISYSELRRIGRWMRQGPCTLQVLAFLGGLWLLLAAFIGIFLSLARLEIAVLVIQFYLIFFSVVIIALEVKSILCHQFLALPIEQYAAALATTTGRGVFYLLVGALSLGQWRVSNENNDEPEPPDSDFWSDLAAYFSWASSSGWLNAFAGGWLLVVALVLLVLGRVSRRKMALLAASMVDEDAVRAMFAEGDANRDGQLDLTELALLLGKLNGTRPSHAELELVMREVDQDGSGTISINEMVAWWSHSQIARQAALLAETQTAGAGATSRMAARAATATHMVDKKGAHDDRGGDLESPLLNRVHDDHDDFSDSGKQTSIVRSTDQILGTTTADVRVNPEAQQPPLLIAVDESQSCAAKNTARAKLDIATESLLRVKAWAVGTGPLSVRVLSCVTGVLLCAVAIGTAIVGNIFRSFNLLKIMVDTLLFCGGVLVIAMDGPLTPLLPHIQAQLKFLTTVAGRGIYQIFLAFLTLSQGSADFSFRAPFAEPGPLLYILLAVVLLVLGVIFMIAGFAATAKMTKLKNALYSASSLRAAFDNADTDRSGVLEPIELAKLCASLGSELTPRQLEVAISMLDTDRDGAISYSEFYDWWHGGAAQNRDEAV